MAAPTKLISKTRAPKQRPVVVPAFGPKGCDIHSWTDFRNEFVVHCDVGGTEAEFPNCMDAWSELPDASRVRPRPRTAQELAEVLEQANTRVINIQEPWATLIAEGEKDIENRSDEFPKGGGWMVVVASKVNYSKPEWQSRLADVSRRMRWAGNSSVRTFTQHELAATGQHAIAVARVQAINNWSSTGMTAKQSIWKLKLGAKSKMT